MSNVSELGEFFKQLDEEHQEKAVRRVVEFCKAVVLTTYSMIQTDSRTVGIAYGSPVLTGRYRASHTVAINRIDKTTVAPSETGDEDSIPAKPIAMVSAIMNALKLGDKVYIANTLPYARRLEFGHSRLKAPEGIYQVTADRVKAKFANVNIGSIVTVNR